ncbi:MAG: cell division protein FtsZ [Alphaproteobacteria bacterium]|nr:cell division protein FtsZ [Alphaproteobacteria bacterium]MBT5860709.1 cell division protein FtsZ [Alphaproteobacteria bacterium]
MTINLGTPKPTDLKPRITVVGVGGAGGNAVNNMIRSNLEGVEFVACNTDAQALSLTSAERKVQMGITTTQGLGSGSKPDIGRAAAEETQDEILDHLKGSHMAFITAGMGGGTGTGAAPIIAQAARDAGILTVGVVTKPFQFEGDHRMAIAEAGIAELQQYVDTLLIIPNQNLFRIANEKTTFADAFAMADDVLHAGVRGVTDLMVMPGLINLDFADVKSVMEEMGKAMMGTGESSEEKRALTAAEAAISNPLLEDASMTGARGVLINVTGGPDMTLFEVDEAVNRIKNEVDGNANIIFGSTFDERMEGSMRVSIVATGIDIAESAARPPRLKVVAPAAAPEGAEQPGLAMEDSAQVIGAGQFNAGPSLVGGVTDLPIPTMEQFKIPAAPSSEPDLRPDDTYASATGDAPTGTSSYAPMSMGGGGASAALKMDPEDLAAPFIAPPPMQSTATAAVTAPEPVKPDPFAEAAVANGGAGARKSAPSLLERMTGLARNRKKSARDSAHSSAEANSHSPEPLVISDPASETASPPAPPMQSPAERLGAMVQAEAEADADAQAIDTPPEMPPEMAPETQMDALPEMPTDLAPEMASEMPPELAMDTPTPAPMVPVDQSPELSVSPADQMAGSTQEEDLLEIPAFLRRQAN